MMKKTAIIALILLAAGCATETTDPDSSRFVDTEAAIAPVKQANLRQGVPGDYSIFTPGKSKKNTAIDYGTWSEMLQSMVFNMGPSTRTRPASVQAPLGTRLVYGHTSPYRLEGNRVFFSALDRDFFLAISEYRRDLVEIGNRIDITALNKNEQLAYWLNLSNAITIEQIGLNYPVKKPSRLKVGDDKAPLDEAKLVTIRGVPLSLNDIRTKIVYPNWRSPLVIYGFFRGEIGGPSIRTSAYTRTNVDYSLTRNAREFVNSLRGVDDNDRGLRVSRIYQEAQPFYFPNWPGDFKDHLRDHLKEEVASALNMGGDVRFNPYEDIIADLAGGSTTSSIAAGQVIDGIDGGRQNQVTKSGLPPQVARIIREVEIKRQELRRRGVVRGTVVISDVEEADSEEVTEVP